MWNILNNWKRTIVEEFRRSKKIDKADFKKFKDAEKRLIKVIEWEESAWENSLIDKAEKKGLNGIWRFLNAGRKTRYDVEPMLTDNYLEKNR